MCIRDRGIYIFNWKILREALVTMKDQPGCDFGKHIIPYCHENGNKICAYDFKGYWKDVGTVSYTHLDVYKRQAQELSWDFP